MECRLADNQDHVLMYTSQMIDHHGVSLSNKVFFSRDVVLGGNCFCAERKCKGYPKNKPNLLLFGGEIQNLRGGISPPKGPEKKNTAEQAAHC